MEAVTRRQTERMTEADGRWQRADGMAEGKGQMGDERTTEADGRGQMADGKAEGRGQKGTDERCRGAG